MVNLREQIESDLKVTLEQEYQLPVELVAPDGTVQTQMADDAEKHLCGQVLWDHLTADPETGGMLVVNSPTVVLRKTALTKVPVDGELWACKIPLSPNTEATLVSHIVERAQHHGSSIGFIKLFLMRAQS